MLTYKSNIVSTLFHCRHLQLTLPYPTAISYWWGPKDYEEIVLDDEVFTVGRNLSELLATPQAIPSRLRLPLILRRNILAWADLSYHEYFSDQGHVHKLLLQHLIHWFEAPSLIGEINNGIMGLHSLEGKLTRSRSGHDLHRIEIAMTLDSSPAKCRGKLQVLAL